MARSRKTDRAHALYSGVREGNEARRDAGERPPAVHAPNLKDLPSSHEYALAGQRYGNNRKSNALMKVKARRAERKVRKAAPDEDS